MFLGGLLELFPEIPTVELPEPQKEIILRSARGFCKWQVQRNVSGSSCFLPVCLVVPPKIQPEYLPRTMTRRDIPRALLLTRFWTGFGGLLGGFIVGRLVKDGSMVWIFEKEDGGNPFQKFQVFFGFC